MAKGFVGRGDELALLTGLVAGVSAGVGGVVLVEGEQGIGKTLVLRAGLAGAEAAGCRVLWGAADELSQRFPLQLMLDCLSSVPESEQGGDLVAGGGVMSGDPVLAGVERLLAVVDRLCARSPVVLVAEDLHWADEGSVLVWSRLCRAAGQMPLLLAGSVRPGSGREDLKRLARVVASAGGSGLELQPLPGEDVAVLVGHLVGGPPGRRLTDFVAQAGGNPLYAGELADGLVREGQVRLGAGAAELTGRVEGASVASSLTALIGERLEGLADNVVSALRWAAVLGGDFSVADLELVSGRAAGDLIDVVDSSLGAGVVAEAGPVFRFRHGLVRQVLYERMPAGLRAALHARTARALADAGARPGRVAAQLAAQFAAVRRAPGTEVEAWVVDWLAAAAPALTYLAPAVAADLIGDVLADLPQADPRREELEAGLVTVAFLLLQHDEVERVGRRLLSQARDPDRAAEMTWMVVYTIMRTGRHAEASGTLREALNMQTQQLRSADGRPQNAAHRGGFGPAWTARLTALDALLQLILGLPDGDASVLDDALAMAERSGDALAIGYALHALSLLNMIRRDATGKLERANRGLAVLGDDARASDLRLMLLSHRVDALSGLDRSAEAIEAGREALVLAEQVGTPRLATARFALAYQHFVIGQWDDALAEIDPAVGLPGPDYLPLSIHGLIALIAAHRANWEAAEAHLSGLPARSGFSPVALANVHHLLLAQALVAERAGRTGEAAEILGMAIDPAVAEGMAGRGLLLPVLARVAFEQADEATLAAAAEVARQEAEGEQFGQVTAVADHCRGLMTGDPGPVLSAADYFSASGRVLDHGLALEDAAVLAARRGDPASARQALAAAVKSYEALGAGWDIQRATERLRPFGVRHRRPRYAERPVSGWGALTPTEVKVADLVAAARSNPDIAAELYMSRYTVQTHVSHILAKLGAQSRVEIAAVAVRHASAHPKRAKSVIV